MTRPIKHRDKWRIRWFDASGTRQSECFTAYSDAERALRRRQAEADAIRAGLRDPAAETRAQRTFEDLCQQWIDHRAPRKRSGDNDESIIRRHLRPELGSLKLVQVDQDAVDRFAGRLAKKQHPKREKSLAPNTQAHVLALLRAMLNYAVELGWLKSRPRVRLPRPQVEDFNWLDSLDKVRAFIRAGFEEEEVAEKNGYPLPGLGVFYATTVLTGMRAGEVAGLAWSSVDFERRLITVSRSFKTPTKTNRIRRVPIVDALLPLMKRWRLRCPPSRGALVFPNANGKMHVPRARIFKSAFRRTLTRAEVKPHHPERTLRFHDLRHTFASLWVQSGGDLFRLQKILGHRDVQMTLRYAHLAPDVFAEDYGRLGQEMDWERQERRSNALSVLVVR